MAKIELAGGFYEDGALQFNAQRCVNMYAVNSEVDNGKANSKLTNAPGHIFKSEAISLSTGTEGDVIGSHVTSDGRYFVIVRFLSSGNWAVLITEVFANGTNSGFTGFFVLAKPERAKVSDNGIVLSIVTGTTEAFFFNLTSNTFALITDADFPAEVFDVTFKDGYFIWLDRDTSRFYVSTINASNPADCIGALDFGVVESNPDEVKAVIGIGNEIAIFGSRTIEYFYNSGNVDFPFERNSGATQEFGTISTLSVNKMDNRVYFISSNDDGYGIIYRLNGYEVERISTHAIERVLTAQADLSNVISYTLQIEGSYFYSIVLDDDQVFQYCPNTGLWNELDYLSDGANLYARPKHFNFAFNKNFAAASFFRTTTQRLVVSILEISKQEFLYYGIVESTGVQDPDAAIGRIRTMQHLTGENKNIQYHSIELDIQKGVGVTPGTPSLDDLNPKITLSISRDGGQTFGNGIDMPIGQKDVFQQRVRAQMLGIARDAVFKFESSSAVQQDWFNIYVDFEALSE